MAKCCQVSAVTVYFVASLNIKSLLKTKRKLERLVCARNLWAELVIATSLHQERKKTTSLQRSPKYPSSCIHQRLRLNAECCDSLSQPRCFLKRHRVIFKHERKDPWGANPLLLEFLGPSVPSIQAATWSQPSPELSPPRVPQGNPSEMPKLAREAGSSDWGPLPTSVEPPRFPTAEKLPPRT